MGRLPRGGFPKSALKQVALYQSPLRNERGFRMNPGSWIVGFCGAVAGFVLSMAAALYEGGITTLPHPVLMALATGVSVAFAYETLDRILDRIEG